VSIGAQPALDLRDEWYTPDEVFQPLAAKYGPFTLDAAASVFNSKCNDFWPAHENALTKPWKGVVWCNPPYRKILDWVTKARTEVLIGNASRVVLLLPAHTATTWFHYALEHGKIEFLRGKVKFGGSKGQPFFGSIVVIFEAQP
jgi:phage N-6-adenine-methyltransferase